MFKINFVNVVKLFQEKKTWHIFKILSKAVIFIEGQNSAKFKAVNVHN